MSVLFVTGSTGFIGQAFVHHAVQASYEVQGLVRSQKAADILSKLGGVPIDGDLLKPGAWQQNAASADYIVHMAQPLTFGGRVTKQRAEQYRADRQTMETNLFQNLRPNDVKRIVYVGGTSYYGEQGDVLKDETTTPNPRGWGPYVVEAFSALKSYVDSGLPIVEAFPGGVYGVGSWYISVLETLAAHKRVVGIIGRKDIFASSIHVEDCARAILHLLNAGDVGQRYFLVDDRPNTNYEIVKCTAQALHVPIHMLLVPKFLVKLLVGNVITDALDYENRLSNAKLHSTGFAFEFPTIDQGIPDIVNKWRSTR